MSERRSHRGSCSSIQQSYVIDKRITPRFPRHGRAELWIGTAIVIIGAFAMMSFTAATFVGTPEFGGFSDAAAVAVGMETHFGRLPGIVFAIALIDASIIGACAVSLSTAYAIGDVFAVRHSLQRKPGDAKLFYTVYAGLIVVAAAFVLTPGTPLDIPPSFQELHRLRHASTSGRRDCGPRDRLG